MRFFYEDLVYQLEEVFNLFMKKVFIILILGFVIITGSLSYKIYQNLNRIEKEWDHYLSEVDSREVLLSQLKEEIGFSGMIHNFKNFVLRRKNIYHIKTLKNMNTIETIIQKISSSSHTSKEEIQHLKEIEKVVNNYKKSLGFILEKGMKMNPSDLDPLVKVDDEPATNAFLWFREYHNNIKLKIKAQINSKIYSAYYQLFFFFLTSLMAFCFIIWIAEKLLSKFYTQIQEQKHILEFLQEETSDGWWDWNIQTNIQFMSPQFWKTLGYDPSSKKHDPKEWMNLVNKEDIKIERENFKMHVETKAVHPYTQFLRYQNGHGGTSTILSRGKVIEWSSDGKPLRMVGTNTDVSSLKKVESLLKDTVKELEVFAYVVSHDLQAPLRHISAFVEKISQRLINSEDSDIQKWCNNVQTATFRMKTLIKDLLNYSRIERATPLFQQTNIEKLINEVLEILSEDLNNNNALVNTKGIPKKLNVSPIHIQQLFQNLLENALKFQKPDQLPTVDIFCVEQSHDIEFIVRDNGIGIDSEYHQTIFNIFHRLHSRSEYEGTGIGLSIAKKIVQHHGGQIWVISEHGKGTEFHFTISKNLSNKGNYNESNTSN